MFVNEYREMLAERLLALPDYSTAQDVRTLELLKIRFGAVCLYHYYFFMTFVSIILFVTQFFPFPQLPYNDCTVMLKDLSDSKRIDAHIWSKLREMDGGEFLNTIEDASFGEEDVENIEKCLEEETAFVLEKGEKGKEKDEGEEEEEEEEVVNDDVETFHATIVSRMCWPTMESEIDYRPPAR